MSSKKLRFRPTVQTLESRRCLAGALGVDEVAATPEEPARGFFAYAPAFSGGVPAAEKVVAAGDINDDSLGEETSNGIIAILIAARAGSPARGTVEDDVIVDGKIITAENYDGADNGGATDTFFSDLGSDDGGPNGDPFPVFLSFSDAAAKRVDDGGREGSSNTLMFRELGGAEGEHSNNFEEIK